MFKDDEIKDIYTEDTRGRKYHPAIISKPKERIEDTPGEVHSMSLNKPMLYAEFKTLTDDLKRLYIKHLKNTYNVYAADIRKMLGCSQATFHRCLSNLDLIGVFPKNSLKKTKKEVLKWNKFLNQDIEQVQPAVPKNTTPTTETHTTIKNFSFTQTGPFSLEEFTKRLSALIRDGEDCTITVSTTNSIDQKETLNYVPIRKEL